MIPRAAPAHLPRLAEAAPLLLVAEGVVDPSPLASAALHVWVIAPRGETLLLHPLGTRAPELAVTLPLAAPPCGTIGIVAPDWQPIAALGAWWSAAEGLPPPFLPAGTGAEALPGVLAVTAEALSAALLREAAAARAAGPPADEPADDAGVGVDPSAEPRRLGWDAARALEGAVDPVALGEESPRPLLRAPAHGRSILLLPALATGGMRRLRVVLAHGTGRGAAVAAWIQPGGSAPADLTDLSRAAPGSAWTGWRPLGEAAVTLDLPLPPGLGDGAGLAIGLRAGDGNAVVEVAEGMLLAGPVTGTAEVPLPAAAPWHGAAATPERPVAERQPSSEEPAPMPAPGGIAVPGTVHATSIAQGARYEGLRLSDHESQDAYRHLQLDMAALRAAGREWAPVRLKFAVEEDEPRLEFRLGAGWPGVFEEWLGRQSDRFGPFLRVFRTDIQDFLELVSDERDAALIAALLEILPEAVAEGCRQAGISAAEAEGWRAAAGALRAAAIRSA